MPPRRKRDALISREIVRERHRRHSREPYESPSINMTNATGADVVTGDVVVVDPTSDRSVIFATKAGDANPLVIQIGGADGEVIKCYHPGAGVELITCDGPAVVTGNLIVTSATNKLGKPLVGGEEPESILGVAMEAGTGTLAVMILGIPAAGSGALIPPVVGTTHHILSATHTDSAASAVTQGSVMVGNATPAWGEVLVGVVDTYFGSDGTDADWAQVQHAQLGGVGAADHQPVVTIDADLAANLLGIVGQALSLDTQADNLVFAGPDGGGPLAPTFRALVAADLPVIGSHWTRDVANGELYPTTLTDQVGIGIADPADPLHIAGLNDGADLILLALQNTGTTVGTQAGMRFASGILVDASLAKIFGELTSIAGAASGAIRFQTRNNGVLANRLMIDSVGLIGSGIDIPLTNYHLYENNADIVPAIRIEQDGVGDAAIRYLLTGGQSWSTGIDNDVSNAFVIAAGANLAANPVVYITTAGSVGFGTYPSAYFHVKGATSVRQLLEATSGTNIDFAVTGAASGLRNWRLNTQSGLLKFSSMGDGFIAGIYDPVLALLTDGRVGINLSTIPKGGIGAARFAIEGRDSHVDGPHLQFTTSPNSYPLMQILNYAHDSVHIGFDAYWDGAWKSSDIGSNFVVQKSGDLFHVKYDSGIAQGAEVAFNEGIILDTAGKVGIGRAPVNLLDVYAATGTIQLTATDVNSNPAIEIANDAVEWKLQVRGIDGDKFRISEGADTWVVVQPTNGWIGMNVNAPLAHLHIDQSNSSAAIPVLALDQADISEGAINFIASARGVITGATNSTQSVRVELNGVVYRLALYANA
ncbi:hypothetical protein LCGC14_0275150 [marine sediment metagenome]|uniref:Uncharacterized protein n=1 Tax=marine sediment metagenome TaxID=412755 RepID=A0A0F9TXE2_9ZZZZ